jgi:hypothetical protein
MTSARSLLLPSLMSRATKKVVAATLVISLLLASRSASAGDEPATLPLPPPSVEAPTPPVAIPTPALDLTTLKGHAFYVAVGRLDLARRYQHRKHVKGWIGGIGGGLIVASLGLAALFLLSDGGGLHPDPNEPPRNDRSDFAIPVVFASTGLLMVVGAIAAPTDPVSDEERAELARGAHLRRD